MLNKFSLRTKIIAIVLTVTTLLVGGGLYAFKQFAENYKKVAFDNRKIEAVHLGQKLAAQFYERYGDVQAFALNPIVKELNAKKLPILLDEYAKLYGIYDAIIVVDKDGRYVSSNSKDSSGNSIPLEQLKNYDYNKSAWFKNALEEKWTEDSKKNYFGTLFEDIHVDPVYEMIYNKKITGTGFTTVIKNEKGEKVGVITNRANNRWFEAEMQQIFKEQKEQGYPDAEVTILNAKGFVISNLAPKRHDDKIEFDTDIEKLLFVENMFETHRPAGTYMAKHDTGSVLSRDGEDEGMDLIGYHFIDNAKWPTQIGWTVAMHNSSDTAFEAIVAAEKSYITLSVMVTFICLAMAIWFAIVISKSVQNITAQLAKNSKDTSEASLQIATQSAQLSESATEQAAALQETVAAVDEISAMVQKNSEAALKSKEVSAQSRDAATKGRETVDNMIQAIDEISTSNEEISNHMEASNAQLSQITKLINDIGSKTKVINEIVFQTKLLSFNASVEAARAGEYGKGFAVVAEEVGNLAQMSGNAAKEITEMLEQSVHQVEKIVSETKSKVDRLMQSSRQKVQAGSETAKECNQALEEILNNVSSVDSLVSEIALASQEQSLGIQEISKAVGQMEEVTQQNSSASTAASTSADELSAQSVSLNSIVSDLVNLVSGQGSSNPNHRFESPENLKVSSGKKSNVVAFASSKSETKQQPIWSKQSKKASGDDLVPSADDSGFDE